jgi:Rps23 Pro-64 3,4-dihydroxylase Tpa1-like proline 4-hydroxylase
MSTSLVSVTTRPPVLIQQQLFHDVKSEEAPSADAPGYVWIDDFLTPDENKQLLKYANANEPEFEGSSVTTKDKDFRKSKVLFSIKDSKWQTIFLDRLKLHLPHISAALDITDFQFDNCEIQLTANNDGDYFKPHADSSQEYEAVANRKITFVYYLHRTPRSYSGGNLLFYHGEPGQSAYDRGSTVTAIKPQNNCLVAFASNRWHEVEMVRCPSEKFPDSRFTVNGWLRSKAP